MDPGFPVPVADPALLVHPDWLVSPVFLVFPAHLDWLVSPVFPVLPVFPDPVDLLMAHPDPVWFHFPDPGPEELPDLPEHRQELPVFYPEQLPVPLFHSFLPRSGLSRHLHTH